MGWTEPLPYIVSGVVALLTAWLTHRRTSKAHKDTVVIDQQKLINETYEAVLGQLREELERRNEAHEIERTEWTSRENRLKARIDGLQTQVTELKTEVRNLRREETQDRYHRGDETRHVRPDRQPRLPEEDSGTDLPT